MSVKFTDNSRTVKSTALSQASLALRFMLDDIDRISTPKTPRDTGDLRNRKLKQVLGRRATIAWVTNYAVYQEEKQFQNYSTSGTGPHFAKNAVNEVVRNSERYFRKAGIKP